MPKKTTSAEAQNLPAKAIKKGASTTTPKKAESAATAKPARQKRAAASALPPGHILTPSLIVHGKQVGNQIVKIPAKMSFFNLPKKAR